MKFFLSRRGVVVLCAVFVGGGGADVFAQGLAVTTIVGGSATSQSAHQNGSFYYPSGVAVDAGGNLYVAEADNEIYKVTPTGVLQRFAGQVGVAGAQDGTGATATFNNPTGLVNDGHGNLYVADSQNSTIRKITAAGVVTTFAGQPHVIGMQDGPLATATLAYPWGLAIDGQGNLYVAQNEGTHAVRKITANGVVSTLASVPGSGQLELGIAVDAAGNVYVSEDSAAGIPEDPPAPANYIYKISPAGTVTLFAGQSAAGWADGTGAAAQFAGPQGLAMEPSGNLLVADGQRIREITPAGVVTTVAGAVGPAGDLDGFGTQAEFTNATGIAVDGFGNAFVTEYAVGALRRCVPVATTQSPTRLLNLSSEAVVSPGAPLSGGFVIQGPAAETVLIRAVGPSLAQFGVAGPLANPALDLYTQTGTRMASTSDGSNAVNVRSASALVGAFPLAMGGADAALVLTLPPGIYSAQASSAVGGSGPVLLEIYEVP